MWALSILVASTPALAQATFTCPTVTGPEDVFAFRYVDDDNAETQLDAYLDEVWAEAQFWVEPSCLSDCDDETTTGCLTGSCTTEVGAEFTFEQYERREPGDHADIVTTHRSVTLTPPTDSETWSTLSLTQTDVEEWTGGETPTWTLEWRVEWEGRLVDRSSSYGPTSGTRHYKAQDDGYWKTTVTWAHGAGPDCAWTVSYLDPGYTYYDELGRAVITTVQVEGESQVEVFDWYQCSEDLTRPYHEATLTPDDGEAIEIGQVSDVDWGCLASEETSSSCGQSELYLTCDGTVDTKPVDDTGDTDSPDTDSSDTDSSDTGDTNTGKGGDPGPCGCTSVEPVSALWALALMAVGGRRRAPKTRTHGAQGPTDRTT
ncbi:MAG: hypothetical protein QGG40_02325 [Myxococcota bacterium]|jgi:hypothetical protein|nr:hypothetical protein [Myxococcota bacterium]